MNKPAIRLKAANDLTAICERLLDSKLAEEVEGLRELIESVTLQPINQVDINAQD